MPKRTVYIVAWEYHWGGGFNWYADKTIAKKMYIEEKINEKIYKKDHWQVYFVEHLTSLKKKEAITIEIGNLQPWISSNKKEKPHVTQVKI